MKVVSDINYLLDFKFWDGARDTIEELTSSELKAVLIGLEQDYPEGLTAVELNNILWFDTDRIAQYCGYDTWDELLDDEGRC